MSFWTVEEWEEWSNELAMLVPEDQNVANSEAAQEHIILEYFRHITRSGSVRDRPESDV